MATITLSDKAPTGEGPASFSFPEGDFTLEGKGSYETDNPGLISNANAHPWLDVAVPVVEEEVADDYDENDPHDNPSADHLSVWASDEAKAEAAANEEAILAEAYPERTTVEEPPPAPAAVTPPKPQFVAPSSTDDEENN